MPAVEHAVIAAAGLGSRLGLGKPKCLIEVAGRPLIYHQLQNLREVPDVRVVVGYEEQAVIEAVQGIRSDVIIVRNPAFRSTTTLTSYAMGAANLKESCLFMDADILFERQTFEGFIDNCWGHDKLIAVTRSKTTDAVFVEREENLVTGFSREVRQDWEWANLCWLPPAYCETGEGSVFERLTVDLPLPCREIISFEIDTAADYEVAMRHSAETL